MNRRKRTTQTLILALVVSLSTAASAQVDAFLQRYDLAMDNLQVAVASVPDDSSKATEEFDQAVNALLSLSRDTTSPSLVSSMEQVFEQARKAVQNRSEADVAVQAAVLAGGFRRLVFESAFVAAAAGDMDTARARLDHIAADMGLSQEVRDELLAAPDAGSLRLGFESAVAGDIQRLVADARDTATTDRGAAYLALAQAYGASLILQDSPRLATPMNAGFLAAADALIAGDQEGLAAAAQTLESSAASVADGAATGTDATAEPTVGTSQPLGGLPAMNPEGEEAEGAAGEPAQATPGPTPATTPAAATPSGAEPASAAGTEAAQAATAVDGDRTAAVEQASTLDVEALRAEWEAERQAARRDTLVDQLGAGGLGGAGGERLADAMLAADVDDIDGALQRLYAGTGRATAAVLGGDVRAARQQVARTADDYRTLLAPLIAAKSPTTDDAMRAALERAQDVVGLRMQDVDALTGQVDAVAQVALGQGADGGPRFAEQVLALWAGWPRLIVLLVFGILAFVPLYLLNLAFGGGNRNWQRIGVALFLLLVPVVYEALASLGSLVAYLTGDASFELLSTYSMFQSPIGQVIWAVLIIIAILLAISGLYGICVQFGLIGRRSSNAAANANATQTGTPTMEATGVRQPADALVDWDEDF